MNIIITNATGQPIYDQIVTQIKNMIISGELKEGDALPSMRFLAKELKISVITTKRAFDDLERDGFICTVQGKGSFVAAKNRELIREEHLKQAEEKFAEGVEIARSGGISKEEIEEMFRLILQGEEK